MSSSTIEPAGVRRIAGRSLVREAIAGLAGHQSGADRTAIMAVLGQSYAQEPGTSPRTAAQAAMVLDECLVEESGPDLPRPAMLVGLVVGIEQGTNGGLWPTKIFDRRWDQKVEALSARSQSWLELVAAARMCGTNEVDGRRLTSLMAVAAMEQACRYQLRKDMGSLGGLSPKPSDDRQKFWTDHLVGTAVRPGPLLLEQLQARYANEVVRLSTSTPALKTVPGRVVLDVLVGMDLAGRSKGRPTPMLPGGDRVRSLADGIRLLLDHPVLVAPSVARAVSSVSVDGADVAPPNVLMAPWAERAAKALLRIVDPLEPSAIGTFPNLSRPALKARLSQGPRTASAGALRGEDSVGRTTTLGTVLVFPPGQPHGREARVDDDARWQSFSVVTGRRGDLIEVVDLALVEQVNGDRSVVAQAVMELEPGRFAIQKSAAIGSGVLGSLEPLADDDDPRIREVWNILRRPDVRNQLAQSMFDARLEPSGLLRQAAVGEQWPSTLDGLIGTGSTEPSNRKAEDVGLA